MILKKMITKEINYKTKRNKLKYLANGERRIEKGKVYNKHKSMVNCKNNNRIVSKESLLYYNIKRKEKKVLKRWKWQTYSVF